MFIVDQFKKGDRRLRAVAAAMFVGTGVLLIGLWYVQIVTSKRFVKDLTNQSFRTVRIPGIRGQILDRNRLPLAENRAAFNVNLYLEELRGPFQEEFLRQKANRKLKRSERAVLGRQTRYQVISNIVNRLSGLMQQPISLNPDQFQQHYDKRLALPLPVLTDLAYLQVARFLEHSGRAPGLELEIQPTRNYPYKTAAAHLLGYVQRSDGLDDDEENIPYHYRLPDYEGKVGLEAGFNNDLRGRAGVKSVLVNSLGYRQSERPITPMEPGHNLILTIDLPLQRVAEKALRSRDANERGAAVVLDARNGDILAMVSNPAYDPNMFVSGITHEDWERLSDEKLKPQVNRASAGIYPPGSIFKIVTGLAGLESGTIDPSVTVTNPGYFQLGKRRIIDLAAPGEYNFSRAFLKSCNTYFIHFGLETGLERLLNMGARFHLGESTDLPTRQNERGRFPTPESIKKERARGDIWTEGDTANLCIGQGEIAVTPLQVALMTAAIANGGKVFWPRLVQYIEAVDESGERSISREFPARLRSELGVQPRNLEIINAAMRADVEDAAGTGRQAEVLGMDVCGKTGTAEVKHGPLVVDRITWFASYAPYKNPRYVVVIVVESGASGGGTCAPMAHLIYRAIQERENPKAKPKSESLAAAP